MDSKLSKTEFDTYNLIYEDYRKWAFLTMLSKDFPIGRIIAEMIDCEVIAMQKRSTQCRFAFHKYLKMLCDEGLIIKERYDFEYAVRMMRLVDLKKIIVDNQIAVVSYRKANYIEALLKEKNKLAKAEIDKIIKAAGYNYRLSVTGEEYLKRFPSYLSKNFCFLSQPQKNIDFLEENLLEDDFIEDNLIVVDKLKDTCISIRRILYLMIKYPDYKIGDDENGIWQLHFFDLEHSEH